MTSATIIRSALGVLFALLWPAFWAQAAPMTFVASTGGGSACTRAAPCADFLSAMLAVDTGGTVTCLDSGPIIAGGVADSVSLTIDCAAVFRTTSGSAFVFDGGTGQVVRIRNMTFNGGASGGPAVRVIGGATLIVENCVFENFATGNATAIEFVPNSAAQLIIKDTIISNNGSGTTGGGIVVQPAGSGSSANVTLDRVHLDKNVTGMFLNAGVGETVRAVISNSTVSGNAFTGVYALSSGGVLTVVMDRSTVANNGGTGLLSQGANSFVFVNGATITGNDTGWLATGGGSLVTEGTNSVYLNRTSNGSPSASIGLQ
jgi:hypothetical protein